MVVDTKIVGGTLVRPDRTVDAAIAVDDGRIAAVGAAESLPAARNTIDASGRLVMPGVVDPHVHVDDHFSIDTYETATRAAALGGITTFIDFGWQAWVGELSGFEREGSLAEGIERKRAKAEDALVDYGLHGAVTREDPEVLAELPDAVEAGVTSFKLFTAYEIGLSYGFIHRVLEAVADLEAVAVGHTEDATVTATLMDRLREAGEGDPERYPDSRPDYAEAMATHNVATMARELGAKYYGFHTSCRKSAEVLAAAREDGSTIRAETCPHYATLTEDAYAEQGTLPLIAPPLRTADDVEALFEHLRRGALDVVSTDHCGYERAAKDVENWWDAAFGANGLQTSLAVFHDEDPGHGRFLKRDLPTWR